MSMGDLFLKLLNMSITAGWLILTVLCIRVIFRKIPGRMLCLLWGITAVRLICPFSIESPFSILPGTQPVRSTAVVEGKVLNDIPSIDSHLPIVEHTINPLLAESFAYDESEHAAPLQTITHAAGMMWVCGMLLLLTCAALSILKLRRHVREAVWIRDNIYICDTVGSPFILGIVRPRVYLPSSLSEKEMHYIMAHERAHLRRKDHWWKPLGYLLLSVYWFHPLFRVAYAMFCRDIELACDEKVAENMTFHEKKEYAGVLLSCAKPGYLMMVYPPAFGEVGIRKRVKAVLHYRKPALWMMTAATAMAVILAVCFLTDPRKDSEDTGASPDLVEAEVFSAKDTGSIRLPEPGPEETAAQTGDAGMHTLSQPETEPAGNDASNRMLYEQPTADQICIKVQPSMIRENNFYYYIPTGEDRKWLSARMEALDLKGEPWEGRWEGHKEKGWQIVYNDMEIRAFEGGYLYCTWEDARKGLMEFFTEAPKVCDYIQIMLMENIGYQNYDISRIRDIISARLDVNSAFTGGQFYSQTITDTGTLQKFEEWLGNAVYMRSGTDCGNRYACLELTLANGDVVKLSMATDGCPNFTIDGVTYDYRPISDWSSTEFYRCFNEIPWEYP